MQIIKEHPVGIGCNVALIEGAKTYGPFEDAEGKLFNMGAKEGDCCLAENSHDRHGDWEFGRTGDPDFFSGPYIIYPEGWSEDFDNDGLQLRVFSIHELRNPDDLK